MYGLLRFMRAATLVGIVCVFTTGSPQAADSPTANDIARFLAGMEPSADSPLMPLTKEPAWRQHQKFFDAAWQALDAHQLSKVRAWSGKNLPQQQPVLYYMFSGPDFLYANAFFPDASTYIMSGLELIGHIPEGADLTPHSLSRELPSIRASLNTLLRRGYFITREMGRNLSRHRLTGTLPVIYVFLARSGKTISDVSLVSLDKDGAVHPQDEEGVESTAKGVKVVFSGSDGKTQTLYYFKTDLSDKGVGNSGFLKFCEKFGTGDSLIKSASYLLHGNNFSLVREFLLKQSAAIVQDDTGIPLRSFNAGEWQFLPFGTYIRPIAIFRHNYQPKLADLFHKSSAGPLDFTIGYHWGKPSNLLLAIKTAKTSQADKNPSKDGHLTVPSSNSIAAR